MIQSKEGSTSQPSRPAIDFDDEPSGPYIPISECYTGKPVSFKGYPNSAHHLPPPPLPSSSSLSLHHPSLPLTPSHGLAYKQPLPTSPGLHHNHHQHQHQHPHQHQHHSVTPNYDVPRSSVFTKVSLPTNSPASGLSSSNTLNGRRGKPHNLTVGPLSQTLNRRVTKPDVSHQNYRNEPPPRPPKPHKLNNRSKSESCSPAAYGTTNFSSNDHLSPSVNNHLDLPSSPGQFNPTINSPLNNINNINNNNHISSNTNTINNSNNSNNNNLNININNHNLVNTTSSQPLTLDDIYDFPRSEPVFTSMRTAIPAPGSRASKGNSHSYTNGPTGHITKPPVFTYDYKGTLPVYLEDNSIGFDLDTCDRSPSTPNSAFDSLSSNGSLSKSLTPPAVNRDLKPKRRDSDSDNNVSPTSPTFTLAPPPAHSKSYSKPTSRHLNDVHPPRVPSRGRQFQHHLHRDESNSVEDIVSHSSVFHRRNSSLDDQSRRPSTIPRKSPSDSPDVTYLDLDLKEKSDKDCVNCSDPYKSLSSHAKDLNETCNLSGSQSTVYKSIDFVATQAFRQLRISSQRHIEKE